MTTHGHQFRTISHQIIVSYFFNFLIILAQPLLLVLLTRNLSVAEYGIYSILFVTLSFIAVLLRYGICEFIKNKIPGLHKEKQVFTFINLFVFFIPFVLITGILLYLLDDVILSIINVEHEFLWVYSIGLIIFIALSDFMFTYYLAIKRISLSAFLTFLRNGLWIILLFIFTLLFSTLTLQIVFGLWLIGVLLSFMFSLFFLRSDFHRLTLSFSDTLHKLSWKIPIKAIKYSTPLVFVVTFSWLTEIADKYIINYYLGPVDVGFYSFAYGLAAIIGTIPTIFLTVLQPYFVESWNLKQNPSFYFNFMLKYILLTAIPAAIGMYVFREKIIILVSGVTYLPAVNILSILLFFPIIVVIMDIFLYTLYVRDMVTQASLLFFISALLNVVLNIILIPQMGAIGAAYTTVISYLVVAISLFYMRPKEINFSFSFLRLQRISVLMCSFFGAVYILKKIFPTHFISLILVSVGLYFAGLYIFKILTKREKKFINSYIFGIFSKLRVQK